MHVSPALTDEIVDMSVDEVSREVVLSTRQGYIVTVSLGNAIIRSFFQHPSKRMINAFLKITNASKLIVSANHEALSVSGEDVKPFHTSGMRNIGFSSIVIHTHTNFLLAAHDNAPVVSVWDVSTQCNNLWICLASYAIPTSQSLKANRRLSSVLMSPSRHQQSSSKLDISLTTTLDEQIAEEELDDSFRIVIDMKKTGHCAAYDTNGVLHLLELLDLTQCNADARNVPARLHRRMSTLARLAAAKDTAQLEEMNPSLSSRFRDYRLVCRNRWLHCPTYLPVEGARVTALVYLAQYHLLLASDSGGSLTIYDVSDVTGKCTPMGEKDGDNKMTLGQQRNSRRQLKVDTASSRSFKAAEVWGAAQPFLSSVEDAMSRQASSSMPFHDPSDDYDDEEGEGEDSADDRGSDTDGGRTSSDAAASSKRGSDGDFGVFHSIPTPSSDALHGHPQKTVEDMSSHATLPGRKGSGEGVVKLPGRRFSEARRLLGGATSMMSDSTPAGGSTTSPTRRAKRGLKFIGTGDEDEPSKKEQHDEDSRASELSLSLSATTLLVQQTTFGDFVAVLDDHQQQQRALQPDGSSGTFDEHRHHVAKPFHAKRHNKKQQRSADSAEDPRMTTEYMCGTVFRVHSTKLASDEAPAAITRMILLDPPLVSIVTASSDGRVIMWTLFGKKCGQFALGPTFREPLFAKMNHISLGQRIYTGHAERLSAFDDVIPPYTNPRRVMPQDGRDAVFQSRRPGAKNTLELPFPCERLESFASLNDCDGKTPLQVLDDIAQPRSAIQAQMSTKRERESSSASKASTQTFPNGSSVPFFSLTSPTSSETSAVNAVSTSKSEAEAEREALLALHFQYQLNDEERVVLYRDWRFAKEILLEDQRVFTGNGEASEKPISLLYEICHTPLEVVVMNKLRDALAKDPNALQDEQLTHRLSGWGDAKKRHEEMLAMEQTERAEQKKKLTMAQIEERSRERQVLDDFFKTRKEHRVVSSGEVVPDLSAEERSKMHRYDELKVSTSILRRFRDELTPAPILVENIAPTVIGSHVELSYPPQRTITNYTVEHEQKCAMARASYCKDKRRRDNLSKEAQEQERKTVLGMPLDEYKASVLREGLLRAKNEMSNAVGKSGESPGGGVVQRGLWMRPEPRSATNSVELKLTRAVGGSKQKALTSDSPAPVATSPLSLSNAHALRHSDADHPISAKGKLKLGRLTSTPTMLAPCRSTASSAVDSTSDSPALKFSASATLFQKQ